MALIDVAGGTIHGKIVYFGPELGGKTTNLRHIHRHASPGPRRELREIADADGRTLFCDVLPLDLGRLLGFAIRYDLYTVPGQPRYERTRAAVLAGADGVVFVADARAGRLGDNLWSLAELRDAVAADGTRGDAFPLVVQYNKRDLPDALPAAALDAALGVPSAHRFEATAIAGVGVAATLRAVCRLVTAAL